MNWNDVYKMAKLVCKNGERNKNGATIKRGKDFICIQMGVKSILLKDDGVNDANCTPQEAMSIISIFA